MAFAVAICMTYLAVRPPSQDYATGHFRAELASRGVSLWNNLWFGGHHLPAYGVVSPTLGGLFGVVPVALVSMLVTTWCAVLIVERWRRARPQLADPAVGLVLFVCGCGVNLWGGRFAFLTAVMFGTLALLALQRGQRWVAAVSAALCGLSSPLGAVSLMIVLAAAWLARAAPRRSIAIVSVAAVVPIGTMILVFPEGGWFPFTAGSLLYLTIAVVAAGWCGRAVPLVRWGAIVYGFVALVAFLVESPLGGNVVRLGWLIAGPVAALTLGRHRRVLIPVIATASLIWNGAYISMAFRPEDRSAHPAYYDSLASFVNSLPQHVRVEVVPTYTFGQADTLALEIGGIARGWETQLDRRLNPEFYNGELDVETYHRWLLDNSVSIVALPLGKLYELSADEAEVIRSSPSYLREVWANADWKVYDVVDASPLADNGATIVDVQADALTVEATRTGWTTVKFRFTDLYRASEGVSCVAPTDDDWIRMYVEQPGRIRLTISFSIDAVVNRDTTSCSEGS